MSQHSHLAHRPAKRSLVLALRVVCTSAALVFLAVTFDWQAAWQQTQFHLAWFLVALAAYGVSQILSAFRWHGLLRAGGMEYPLTQVTRRYFEGVFFNLCLPTAIGGDVWKAYSLGGSAKRRLLVGASVFVDRLFGLAALVFIMSCAAMYRGTASPLVAVLGGAGLVSLIPFGLALLRALARRIAQVAPAGRLRANCEKIQTLDTSLVSQGRAFTLSLVIQLLNVATVGLLCATTGVDVAWSHLCLVVPLTIMLTMLPLSIGGIGVREGGFAVLLSGAALSTEACVSLGFLWTVVMTITSLVGGIVYLCGRQTQTTDFPVGQVGDVVQSEVSLG